MTFLNNWFRADRRGTALTYASAVAVEEKSVIDYNPGNPDGVLDPGEEARPPRIPLVAIYPKEGTLYSDNPLFVLDADWVTDEQRPAAELFEEFVSTPENQEKVLEFGFRPGNPEVAVGAPIDDGQRRRPRPARDPARRARRRRAWSACSTSGPSSARAARVLMVLDVSGSMGEPADPEDPSGPTKLDLAKQAVHRGPRRVQGRGPGRPAHLHHRSRRQRRGAGEGSYRWTSHPSPRSAPTGSSCATRSSRLTPLNGTPLYDVTGEQPRRRWSTSYDPALINAVVVLTDGVNDDGDPDDDERAVRRSCIEDVTAHLQRRERHAGAHLHDRLRRGCRRSDAASRSPRPPTPPPTRPPTPRPSTQVFTAVVSNF